MRPTPALSHYYHIENIEEYTMNVMETMENAGLECLPTSRGGNVQGKRPNIPGWYHVWLSAGKPVTGDLFTNMKASKQQFKFAVRRLKRCSDRLQSDMFVSNLLQGGSNLFQEIRKFRGTAATFSSRIDEEVGAHNITQHFANF